MVQALALGPDLVKPNREEYGDGSGWQTAGELHLTDGGGSVAIRRPDGVWRVAPPVVAEVNPIGSGDCYLAALAHARLSGWDLATQWRWAAAAGAANAARADVAMIGTEDCLPQLEQVVIAADGPQG
jgi:tagatose 6-phosphate kinase